VHLVFTIACGNSQEFPLQHGMLEGELGDAQGFARATPQWCGVLNPFRLSVALHTYFIVVEQSFASAACVCVCV
jgi:hypothetical protein